MISKETFDVVRQTCECYDPEECICYHVDSNDDACDYEFCPKNRKDIPKSTPLSPDEFAKRMAELHVKYIIEEDDNEDAHREMDRLITNILIDLGYEDGVMIFRETPKYYT